MGVGGVQDRVHIIGAVFNFLCVELRGGEQVAPQVGNEQAGQNYHLHTAEQIVVGDSLQIVTLDAIAGKGPVRIGQGAAQTFTLILE